MNLFFAATYSTDVKSNDVPFLSGYPYRKLGERSTAVFPTDLQQKVSFGIHSHLGVTKHLSNERQVGYALLCFYFRIQNYGCFKHFSVLFTVWRTKI